MAYQPPSGFVEPYRGEADDPSAMWRFHARRHCPRVENPDALRAVDKPYSARRCHICADEHRTRGRAG